MHIYYATRGLRGRPYHSDMKSFHNSRKSHKNRVIEFHEQVPKINR